jgi:hypothetical protein
VEAGKQARNVDRQEAGSVGVSSQAAVEQNGLKRVITYYLRSARQLGKIPV